MDEELIQIFDTNPMEIHSVNGPQFIPAQRYNPASKKPEPASMIGKVFGRWTVIGESVRTQSGERKWLCRCECGTQRYVLERSLRSGGSLSCGCLRKERSQKANSPDLTGQKFGELTAIRRVDSAERKGGARWLCQCACGAEYEVLGTLLVTGRRTHCPGKSHEKNYAYAVSLGKSLIC